MRTNNRLGISPEFPRSNNFFLFSTHNFSSQIDMDFARGDGGAFRRHAGRAVAHDEAPSVRVLLRLHPGPGHRQSRLRPRGPGWGH